MTVRVLVIVSLYLFCAHGLVEQVIISQNGKRLQHALQVVGIVEEEGVLRKFGRILDIVVVQTDQLTAGEDILAVNSKILLQRLLFTVRKAQNKLVGRNPSVDVKSLKSIKAVRQGQLLTFLLDEGEVKVIPVKMDQIAVQS